MTSGAGSLSAPVFGKIYCLGLSVQKTLRLIAHNFMMNLSTRSSDSSSSDVLKITKKEQRHGRPCLCWDVNNEFCTFLLMTSFNGKSPMGEPNDPQTVVSNMSNQSLIKHLVSISPTPPTPGRRCINIQRSPNTKPPNHPNNCFLILMPVKIQIQPGMVWPVPLDDLIPRDDLLYINDLLTELEHERKRIIITTSMGNSMSLSPDESNIPTARFCPMGFYMDMNNSEPYDDDTASETSDCATLFMDFIDKNDSIQYWLQCHFNNDDSLKKSNRKSSAICSVKIP